VLIDFFFFFFLKDSDLILLSFSFLQKI
jgi:hypothetical protein